MQTVVRKGRELRDVDVDFISSVQRPATRKPFGIMKSEDADNRQGGSMFDLFIKKHDRAPAPAAITSVIVKGEPNAATLKALGDLGLKTDEAQSVDGHTLLVQDASIEKSDTVIFKLDDNVAVMLPSSIFKMDGGFAASCAQRGFYPSISIATDLLQEELYKSVSKAKDGTDAAEMISKATGEFGAYMSQLARSLPSTVFKMEESAELKDAFVVKTETVVDAPKSETVTQPGSAETVVDAVAKSEDEPTAEEIAEIEKGEGKAWADMTDEEKKAAKAKKKAAPVEKTESPAFDLAAMAELITKSVVDQVSPQIAAVSNTVAAMGTRLEQVEQVSKSADQAVRGTVLGNVFGDHEVSKSDDDGEGYVPLLDSGFSSRN